MNSSDKIIILLIRYRYFFIACICLNLIVSGVSISTGLKEVSYKAKVKIVFNQVKRSFENNRSVDYLFGGDAYTFINTLQMDGTLNTAIEAFDLVEYYQLNRQHSEKEPIAIARTLLRKRISFDITPHGVYLYYTDQDPVMAEKVLRKLAEGVKTHYYELINRNKKVTGVIVEKQLLAIDAMIDSIGTEVDKTFSFFPEKTDFHSLNTGKQLDDIVARKITLSTAKNATSTDDEIPKYDPYFIIDEGVAGNTANWLALIALAIIGNTIAFVIEVNCLFLFHYLSTKYRELQSNQLV